MNKKTVFNTHSAAISALFILGSGVITLPALGADEYTLTAYLLATALSFIIYFILFRIADMLFSDTETPKTSLPGKIFTAIVYITAAIFSLFCFADTFKIFVRFAADLLLKSSTLLVAVIIFGGLILFFASRRQEDILKFALLSFTATLIVMIFFFFAAVENFELQNIFIFRLPKMKSLRENLKPYLKEICLPVLLLPVYHALVFRKNRIGATSAGIALGHLFLGLCISSAVLLFGAQFAGEIEYPYAAAVSTVNIGRLFTRMDYFSYFIYFVSAVTRITVCLFIVRECLKRLDGLCEK